MELNDTERDEITNEANIAVKIRCTKGEVVKSIALKMGLSESTVYDYLSGRIKMNLRFLKAVVGVTEDPFLMKYLEPEGMSLMPHEDVFYCVDGYSWCTRLDLGVFVTVRPPVSGPIPQGSPVGRAGVTIWIGTILGPSG